MTTVAYDHAPSGWNEALPLGNGHFGGMVYFEDHLLTIALNHYEIYYRKLHRYSKQFLNGDRPDYRVQYGRTFEQLKRRAETMYRNPGQEPFFLYGDALSDSSMYRKYGKPPGGVSHYPTGEIRLRPSKELEEPDCYSLQLDVKRAVVRLRVEKAGKRLEADTIVAQDGDYVVTEIRQTAASLIESVDLTVPARRYADMNVTYRQHDESTFYYVGSFFPDGEDKERYPPFSFIVITRLIGAKGSVDGHAEDGAGMRLRVRGAGERLTLLTTVLTEEQAGDLLQTALQRLDTAVGRIAEMTTNHRVHWQSFWCKSSVTLPDKLLEDLWHVNLYAIACSSGKGGTMREQACGLNGLWDIKQPTKWGSMWYWDVNIQAAFWPLYTANHLELADAFNEGLLSYVDDAERMAKQFYGLEGVAGDYPHALYFSIWPWCAQFLWDYYRYGMDADFLREKAYPLFQRIAGFFEGYLQYDAETGQYDVFPDISPEQGPLTRNSTCTLAAVKYLLRIAAEANKRLGEAGEDRRRWKEIADRLAPYPSAVSAHYGDVLLDSEWAPADMHLRHPSLLMPICPAGEIDRRSEASLRRRAENTLRYAEENTEFGMFQFGWLSCTASRLGKGDTALRLLYEQGIDLSLRCNGLFAEETERWMNYCNITNEPLYHPHMMEASGGIVAAVNEMLLQSYDGVIEVFPAVPKGERERERTVGLYDHQVCERVSVYGKWNDCAFRGLLAVGGLEVSADMADGQVRWVEIRSRAGGHAAIRDPFPQTQSIFALRVDGVSQVDVEYVRTAGCLRFDTEPEGIYLIYPQESGTAPDLFTGMDGELRNGAEDGICSPRVHSAHTRRRVFLGKDRDTHHFRLLDHFTFDSYAGNSRESRLAAYRLDFGVRPELLHKDYDRALPRQVHTEGVLGQTFRKISPESAFAPRTGIGWELADSLEAIDRGEPDLLRRDFMGGTGEAVFRIELPKGRYDLLIVSGDGAASSGTELEIPGQVQWKTEKALKAGEFATDIISFVQRRDGYVTMRFRSCAGLPWRVNALVINKSYAYL